jgi:hypothetical protein
MQPHFKTCCLVIKYVVTKGQRGSLEREGDRYGRLDRGGGGAEGEESEGGDVAEVPPVKGVGLC